MHLFATKMTSSPPFFIETVSLLSEYPNTTAAKTARSVVECGVICLTDAMRCQHFYYSRLEGAKDGCRLLK